MKKVFKKNEYRRIKIQIYVDKQGKKLGNIDKNNTNYDWLNK